MESAEHFLRETGMLLETIRKEQERALALLNFRHFRVMLEPGPWAALRFTWLESAYVFVCGIMI